jgi:hypothetical protein
MKTRTTGSPAEQCTTSLGPEPGYAETAAGHDRVSRRVRRLAGALLLLTALAGAPASAVAGTSPPTVYCVGTVAQLKSALAAIQTTPGSFDLRIRSGYYPLTPPGAGALNYGLELRKIFRPNDGQVGFNRISGTWNEGCQQRAAVIDGTTSTLIDGQGQTGNLLVYSDSFAAGVQPTDIHELVIERLQFANGNTGTGASCVRVTPLGTRFYRLNVTIDRLRIELCEGTALNSQVEASVTVRNSIFLGNSDATTPGLSISAGEGVASLYNSTFRFNRMGAQNFPGQVRLSGSTVYVFNNLFADTDFGGNLAPIDVRVSEGAGIVRNNRLDGGVIHQLGGGLIQSGNTAVSPGFSNPTGPQLANNSPLRDLGLTAVPLPGFGDLDFVGNPRVRGAAVDIGAYELAPLALPELVFANGFESP